MDELKIWFCPRRERLDDGELWYIVDYVNPTLALRHFGVTDGILTMTEMIRSISRAVRYEMRFKELTYGKSVPYPRGYRVFVKDYRDITYLKLLGDTIFEGY